MPALRTALDIYRALPAGERILVGLFGLIWILSAPILFQAYRTLYPSPDQSIFDYIAWLGSQGLSPYRDSFEINWPGKIWIHRLAQVAFGNSPDTFRAFDFLVMQAATIMMSALLWRQGLRVGAAVMLATYPAIYITGGHWMAGQRDIVAAQFLLIACYWLAGPRRSAAGMWAAGATMAFAVAIRPTYLAFLVGAILLEAVWPKASEPSSIKKTRTIAWISLGAATTVIGFVLIGAVQGSLGAWYEQSVRYVLDCYASGPAPQSLLTVSFDLFARSWHWIALGAIGGLISWALRTELNRHLIVLLIGAMATFTLSFIVQKKGFGYHLGGFLPVMMLLFAVLVDTCARAATNRKSIKTWIGPWHRIAQSALWLGLASVLAIGALGTITKLRNNLAFDGAVPLTIVMKNPAANGCESAAAADAAADFIAKTVPENEYILPINCGYRAGYLSQRLPASRFATSTAFGDSKRRCKIGDRFMATYAADILARKPTLILVSSKHFDRTADRLSPLLGHSASEGRAADVATNYRKVAQFGQMLVFRRDVDPSRGLPRDF